MKFFELTESNFVVNIDHVMSVGRFKTYEDKEKTRPVFKFMIKLRMPSKGAHPYTHEITQREYNKFLEFLRKKEL